MGWVYRGGFKGAKPAYAPPLNLAQTTVRTVYCQYKVGGNVLTGWTKDDPRLEPLLIRGPFKLPDRSNCYNNHNHLTVTLAEDRVTDNVRMSLNSATNSCFYITGCASSVLTATHHSYGSPRLSDFFFPSRLWGSDPSTDIHAKWLKRRVFTQGCAFCSKNRNFSYPLISRAPKGSQFCKFLDLENFSLDLAFNVRGQRVNTPYSSSELNESDIVNRQSGVTN